MTITDTNTELWDDVHEALSDARLIAWDGCHKIYIALDDEQAQWFREYYEIIVDGDYHSLLATITKWWDDSCGLRFINGVAGSEDNPQFTTLIAQFADQEDDDDEDGEW
jgi:hypothetical protein